MQPPSLPPTLNNSLTSSLPPSLSPSLPPSTPPSLPILTLPRSPLLPYDLTLSLPLLLSLSHSLSLTLHSLHSNAPTRSLIYIPPALQTLPPFFPRFLARKQEMIIRASPVRSDPWTSALSGSLCQKGRPTRPCELPADSSSSRIFPSSRCTERSGLSAPTCCTPKHSHAAFRRGCARA